MTVDPSLATSANAKSGRSPQKFGFAMGQRFFLLLAVSFAIVPLMFIAEGFRWLLLIWNVCVLSLFATELLRLPRPAALKIRRSFAGQFKQLEENRVELGIHNDSGESLRLYVQDDVPESLSASGVNLEVRVAAGSEEVVGYPVTPRTRGESNFGKVYVRYETGVGLAQRWAVFDAEETIRVLPSLTNSKQRQAFLVRSRQIQLQQRTAKLRGQGREFESLREFRTGDEIRNVCWTATARRSKLVTTQRQVERSQTIWSVIDCGRLMRARINERSKLDYSVEAAITLAQVAEYGGDGSAMLAYGRYIQQRRLPGRGSSHVHAMLQQAALVREEGSEADHFLAVNSLLMLQKSRSLVIWITDLADLAMTPEVVSAALLAAKRHLVVVAVIGQPDVTRIISKSPSGTKEAFLYAAASEMTARRELALARLRSRGVRAIEISAPNLAGAVLNQYLDIKRKNLL